MPGDNQLITYIKKVSKESIIIKTFILCFSWFWILNVFFPTPLFGQSDSTGTENEKTSRQEYPKRMKECKTWEWVLSSPGKLINLPFKIVLKGVGGTIGIIYDTKIINRINDFLTSDDGLRALQPIYSSRSGAGIKLFQKDLFNKNSKFEISASAGLRYRQKYQIAFKGLNLLDESVRSDISVGYHLFPDERFYGIGRSSGKDNNSNFAHEQGLIQIGLDSKLGEELGLTFSFTLEHNNILEGKNRDEPSTTELYSLDELPGLESEIRILGAGVQLSYDSRNIKGGPTSGRVIKMGGGIFQQIENDDYGFWKAAIDIRQYIHLFYGRTIILRIAGEMTEPLSGKTIPFYHLSELGRSETIRGFNRGRFRDRDMLLSTIEYRYPIWKSSHSNVDAFLFIDAGQVAKNIINDINKDNIRIGYGGGISLWKIEEESLRLFMGKSDELFRLYLELNI